MEQAVGTYCRGCLDLVLEVNMQYLLAELSSGRHSIMTSQPFQLQQ